MLLTLFCKQLALKKFDKLLQPGEELVAEKLSYVLNSVQSQPHQMLQECQKFIDLIIRKGIHRKLGIFKFTYNNNALISLAPEIELLLGQIYNSLKSVKLEFKERHQVILKFTGNE